MQIYQLYWAEFPPVEILYWYRYIAVGDSG